MVFSGFTNTSRFVVLVNLCFHAGKEKINFRYALAHYVIDQN